MARLEQITVEVGTPLLFPEDGSADLNLTDFPRLDRHRFAFTGTGAATATVELKVSTTDTFRLIDPPVTWAEIETLIAAGVFQFRITAVGNDVIADIESYKS